MIDTIYDEVPHSQNALVSICIYFIGIVELIRDQLVPLATFEFHLFLEKLVFLLLAPLAIFEPFDVVWVLFYESLLVSTLVCKVLHCLDG